MREDDIKLVLWVRFFSGISVVRRFRGEAFNSVAPFKLYFILLNLIANWIGLVPNPTAPKF